MGTDNDAPRYDMAARHRTQLAMLIELGDAFIVEQARVDEFTAKTPEVRLGYERLAHLAGTLAAVVEQIAADHRGCNVRFCVQCMAIRTGLAALIADTRMALHRESGSA